MVRFLTGLLAVLLAGFLGGAWFFSSELIAGDVAAWPADAEALAQDAGLGEPETFAVVSSGVGIEGWYFPGSRDCGIVVLHGHGGNRTSVLDRLADLSDLGCHLVAADARGHGRSGGDFHTFGALDRRDTSLVIRWLGQRADLAVEDVGLVGVSYGGATALGVAADVPVAFVVADSPYESVRAIATYQGVEQFGEWVTWFVEPAMFLAQQRAGFDADDAAPVLAVADTEVPILVIHEVGDDYVPIAHSEAIAEAGASVTFVAVDAGGGHATMFSDDPIAYRAIIDDFLDGLGWPAG